LKIQVSQGSVVTDFNQVQA